LDNIRIIKTGITVSKILKQLEQYPEDWGHQKKIEGALDLTDRGFSVMNVSALQLVMGGVEKVEDFVGDTEICIPTPAYNRHTEIIGFLNRHFKGFKRCGFLSMPVGGHMGMHIDMGTYYLTKDRYHLAIQGTYKYFVGDEEVVITPGTLFWFNNKMMHGAENIGDCTRITFVFDAPHKKK